MKFQRYSNLLCKMNLELHTSHTNLNVLPQALITMGLFMKKDFI